MSHQENSGMDLVHSFQQMATDHEKKVPKKEEKTKSGKGRVKKDVSKPPTYFKSTETGVCSMFIIQVEKGRKAYRYDVDIYNVTKDKSLAKGADDGQRALNRNLCYELLTAVYQKTDAFYGMDEMGGEIVYDCKMTMFTSVPIRMEDPMDVLFGKLSSAEVNDYVRQYCGDNCEFTVKITPNKEVPELNLSDYAQYATKESLFNEDRSMRTFLEMATGQYSINNNIYTPIGPGKLFETSPENSQEVDNGMVLRMGVSKGVRVVQNGGNPVPALILDAKMCPFYQSQNLDRTVLAICKPDGPKNPNDWRRVLKILLDIRVEVTYSSSRSFGIGGFSERPCGQQLVLLDGARVPIIDYYRKRHNIELKYPHWPAVIANTPPPKGRRPELFPIELLMVMEDQRVSLEKMSKDLSSKLLKYNTIPPADRLAKILRHAGTMALFDRSNAVLRAFGITIVESSNRVVIGVRTAPQIMQADGQVVTPDPAKADWRRQATGQYLVAKEISNWAVLCEPQHRQLVNRFVAVFIDRAKKKGLKFIAEPEYAVFREGRWDEAFKRCASKDGIEFIMLIDARHEDSHGKLKYFEARYKVLTQHVTLERVSDVVNLSKMQTLDNIVHKTNCKNYGLNYRPVIEQIAARYELSTNRVLVIGLDVAHPPPPTVQERRFLRARQMQVDSMDPSVVGICANMAKDPHIFVGDYFFQETRREAIDVEQLRERTVWIHDMLEQNRQEAARPRYIFVLRDGLSEGQISMAVNQELNAIREGCLAKYGDSYHPKFILVIGTKRHFKRFFTFRGNTFQNLDPGSVIAEKFVREDVVEFFMQSHFPLKGAGKPVQYAVPVDEIGLSQDELQAFLNALCYSHQIVYSAISLPEPIYQADELAKRGSNNYKAMKLIDGHTIPRLADKVVDARALTDILCYMNSPLQSTRFTA